MAAYDIKGKVFFVTGGAEGIGKAYIEAVLAKEAKVFFVDIEDEAGKTTLEEFKARFGHENIAFALCDIRNREQFEESFEKAVRCFGQVDVMYNNAGIVGEAKPKTLVDTNLLGCIYGTEIALAHMRKDNGGKGGRIINMSSIAGVEVYPHIPVYGATKQAVRSFTTSLSMNPNIEEMGVEYAVILLDSVKTGVHANLKEGDVLFLDDLLYLLKGKRDMSVDTAVQGFLKLVTMEKINGAMLLITKAKTTFVEMKMHEIEYP